MNAVTEKQRAMGGRMGGRIGRVQRRNPGAGAEAAPQPAPGGAAPAADGEANEADALRAALADENTPDEEIEAKLVLMGILD